YYVTQCSNGREAMEQILRQAPDLVISDVMMPEMDGNELCKNIRSNVLISHVPVILLTARSTDVDQIQGLEVGADAFLAKPFNVDVLMKMTQNVIRNHERLKNTFSGQQDQTGKIEVPKEKTPDERLMDRINRVLNERISDPTLSAEIVAREVGLSRVHLYRKLKELTNQSARDYIRNMRIIKAADLLTARKVSIGEVANSVGYTDQRNFSTAFKSIYGMTPSEYMEKHLDSNAPQEHKETPVPKKVTGEEEWY
ncbi:MAG: response regulator, partial [Bacteroidales bacterium]|nr:response regulator [Bacteroidales bacterium]